MGGAFTAIADDASSMYWNVSGLAKLKRPELLVNYTPYIVDIGFTYLGYAHPLKSGSVIGISVLAMTMDEMKVTAYGVPGEFTGETFKAGSHAVGISYAKTITDRFSFGATGKIITERIAEANATGLAIDVGTLYRLPFKDVRLGVSISNFGTKMRITGDELLVIKDIDPSIKGNNESINAILDTDSFDLPLLVRVGLATEIIETSRHRLTLAVDAMHPNDNSEYMNIGGEYTMAFADVRLSVRGGLRQLFMEDREGKYAAGVGIIKSLAGGQYLDVDYAVETSEFLPVVRRLSIRIPI